MSGKTLFTPEEHEELHKKEAAACEEQFERLFQKCDLFDSAIQILSRQCAQQTVLIVQLQEALRDLARDTYKDPQDVPPSVVLLFQGPRPHKQSGVPNSGVKSSSDPAAVGAF